MFYVSAQSLRGGAEQELAVSLRRSGSPGQGHPAGSVGRAFATLQLRVELGPYGGYRLYLNKKTWEKKKKKGVCVRPRAKRANPRGVEPGRGEAGWGAGRKPRPGDGGSPALAGQDGGVQAVLGQVGGYAGGMDFRVPRRRALL